MMRLSCDGRVVADYVVKPELALTLAPRPYLHPVRTLAGVRVTDALPQDHPWHLGVSFAVQHVQTADGRTANFWGGRTYLRDQGYQWLDDHGRVEHVRWVNRDPSGFEQELAWRVPGNPVLLREFRTMAVSPLLPAGKAGRGTAWVLRMGFGLENVTQGQISLGSPGTHGRPGAGYGGFFWRAAASEGKFSVCTPDAEGEDDVHGRPAEWLTFGADEPGTGRPWSLLLAGEDAATRADPWFVRTRDYPGVGSALAFDRPIVLNPAERVSRSLLVVVVDGTLGREEASAVLATARGK
ncbi:MAG TPA: PmoA family protein [Kineosporiaceae bacterium]|nr:PmoA family protein [Kineosporiaceae bacterium]